MPDDVYLEQQEQIDVLQERVAWQEDGLAALNRELAQQNTLIAGLQRHIKQLVEEQKALRELVGGSVDGVEGVQMPELPPHY